MSRKELSKDFTTGSIPKQLILFTLPFMASNALQVLYSTVDMVVVGEYVGTEGISAVSQSSQIVNFATMVCLGFSNGGQVLVAQALGAGKKKEQNSIIGTLFTMLFCLSLFFTAAIFLFNKPIAELMNIPQEALGMSLQYMMICAAGLVFTAGYNMISAVLRGMGDSKRPFLFILIASVTNLVLDLLFVGVFHWGVAGAALATIIGQAFSFMFSLFYLYKHKEAFGFDFKPKSFKPTGKYVGMMFRLGTPMAIQSGFINLSMLFVNSLINEIGLVASATFGVGVRIDDIVNKLSQGLNFAALPMISQNIAAGKQKRAKQVVWYTWLYSGIYTVVCIAIYLIFGKELFMLFDDNPAVHELSSVFISAILWMFPAMAMMRGSSAFLQGIGNAKLSLILSILDGVVLRIGLSWLFGIVFQWGFYGFVLGYAIAPYGCGLPGVIYFLSGVWKKRRTLADEM